ncbi:MAG: hypothetical protein ACRDC9_03310 [Plesiomonas shigelloides]
MLGLKNKKTTLLLLVLISAVFGYSSFSSVLFIHILKLPYIPEPFLFLLFIMVYIVSVRSEIKINKLPLKLVISLVLILSGVLIGVVKFNTDVGDALSSARPYLYILLGATFAPLFLNFNEKKVLFFALCIVIGDIFAAIYNFNYEQDYRGISAMNVFACCMLMASSVLTKKIKYILFSFALCVLAIFVSGFRIVMLSTIVGFIFSILYMIKHSNLTHRLYYISFSILFVFIAPLVIVEVSSFFVDDFRYAVYRIINRTIESFELFMAGDVTAGRYQEISGIDRVYGYISIFPSGFIMLSEGLTGYFNDAPYLNFIVTYGVVLSAFILTFIILNSLIFIFSSFFYYNKFNSDIGLLLSVNVMMLIQMAINGRFLYITYESIMYGVFIGLTFKYNLRFLFGLKRMCLLS